MAWTRARRSIGAVAAGMVALMMGTATAAGSWQVVNSPNVPGSNYNELDSVRVTASNQAWAVGFARTASIAPFRALVERWNGGAWSIVSSAPVTASDDTRLLGLGGTGTSDVWAVGSDTPSGAAGTSLIEHWDGTAWTRVPSPAGEPAASELLSVSALSPTDVWAVGDSRSNASFQTLVEHWNGSTWSIVPDAGFPATGFNHLSGVAAVSSQDVWAVGRIGRHSTPIIEHWDGSSWTQVGQPANGFDSNLRSVSAVSSTDIWAAGSTGSSSTLVEHWDGTTWSVVPSPNPPGTSAQSFLTGVVVLGAADVWAVGSVSTLGSLQTLTEHWDGTAWTIAPSPSPGSSSLAGVGGLPGGPLFAVGSNAGPVYTTLVLQH